MKYTCGAAWLLFDNDSVVLDTYLMDRQMRLPVSNLPDGVHMSTEGGFHGYSGGNLSLPMYTPPA